MPRRSIPRTDRSLDPVSPRECCAMKKLGGIDASFLYMETPEHPMHVARLTFIELPAGYSGSFYKDYKAHIGRRMHLVPIFSQKLVPVPFEIDHPVWVDDEAADLAYHGPPLDTP